MWLSVNWLLTEKVQKKEKDMKFVAFSLAQKTFRSTRKRHDLLLLLLWCLLKSEMCCLIPRTENIASSWFFIFFILPHLNEKGGGGTSSLPKRSTLCVIHNEAKTCWGYSLTVLMHFNILWLSDRKKQQGRKKKNPPKNPLGFLQMTYRGASAIMRRDGENCCSRNSFFVRGQFTTW